MQMHTPTHTQAGNTTIYKDVNYSLSTAAKWAHSSYKPDTQVLQFNVQKQLFLPYRSVTLQGIQLL